MVDAIGRDVWLSERTGGELVRVSAWPTTSGKVARALVDMLGIAPPERTGTTASSDSARILALAPHQWLIVSPATERGELAEKLGGCLLDELGTAVELSAARCIFILRGPNSRAVLAKLLPLDLSPSAFTAGQCAQSAIGHVSVTLQAQDAATFEIMVYRSFAQHLWEMLVDAALEFGLAPSPRASASVSKIDA